MISINKKKPTKTKQTKPVRVAQVPLSYIKSVPTSLRGVLKFVRKIVLYTPTSLFVSSVVTLTGAAVVFSGIVGLIFWIGPVVAAMIALFLPIVGFSFLLFPLAMMQQMEAFNNGEIIIPN